MTAKAASREAVSGARRVRVSTVAAATFFVAGSLNLLAAINHVPLEAAAAHHALDGGSDGHWVSALVLAVLGIVQLFVAGDLLLLPSTRSALIGISLNTTALVVYVLSRTVGLHLGPGPTENMDLLDLAVAGAEVAGIVALCACLPSPIRGRTTNVLLGIGVLLLGLRALGLLGA